MTIVEALLALAESLDVNAKRNNGVIICVNPPEQPSREDLDKHLARTRIALWLKAQPDHIRFQALFEEWDMSRLVREVF